MAKPPYGIIWSALKAGRVVPFLGAGASFVGRQTHEEWNPASQKFLPSGVELARYLAGEANLPSTDVRDRDDLAKVSSYFSDVASDRDTLKETLRPIFSKQYSFGALHEFLASVPAHLVIVSTNYDTLLEQAFNAAGKPYDLVVYPSDRKEYANAVLWWKHAERKPEDVAPNELDIDLTKTTVIYKMHGTVSPDDESWDNYVITEEDYIEFLSRMTTNTAIPSLFFQHFRERRFLFLAYSLRDWNLRVVLKNLNKCLLRGEIRDNNADLRRSWAIQLDPSELESKLWQKRNVEIYHLPLDVFVRELSSQST